MRRKALVPLLLVLLLLPLATAPAQAAVMGRQTGSISVTMAVEEAPVEGAELAVYYVATVMLNPQGELRYAYTDSFRGCDAAFNDPYLCEKITGYVQENAVTAAATLTTDAMGEAQYGDAPLGLYLVVQDGAVEGFSSCSPFLVTLPIQTDSEIIFDVDAAPKTEVERLVDITVRVVWLNDRTNVVHDPVTVELRRDGEVVETALLGDDCAWQIVYKNMPQSDAYSILELDPPEGYRTSYNQDGYVFTVYNISTLAQTGQLIWPIPVLAVAGLLLLTLGFVILRKSGKRDA